MEIDFIKEFLVLAHICNYGRASDELYISQSTLFNHIKSLEREMGVPLFVRDGKKIVLSDYGQIFLSYADTIIDAVDKYNAEIEEKKHGTGPEIRIGIQYRITDLIKEFRRNHADYVIYTMDIHNYDKALKEEDYELAFIRGIPEPKDDYNIVPYIKDSIVVAVYGSHPIAEKKSISMHELKYESFIMISQPNEKECFGVTLCKQAGFIPKIAITAVNGSEAARLVADGAGISLFLKEMVTSENIDNIILVDLTPEVYCDISLCWRKDSKVTEAVSEFVEFVKCQP